MSLHIPPIDQRSFDDLVDEARRRIKKDCPTWTDLSVHDPGLVLVEALAHLTETLIARLNRVPERVYIELLKLIGVKLLPPSAAEVTLTFTLSKTAETDLEIPIGTQVGAGRQTQSSAPLVFTTAEAVTIPAGQLQATVRASHADLVRAELVGYGTGQPGLAVRVKHPPILAPVIQKPGRARARDLFDLEVGVEVGPGEQESRDRVRVHDGKRFALWEERETFADTKPGDRVFVVDRASGLIVFAPAVQPEGEAGEAAAAAAAAADPQVRTSQAAPGAGRMILAWYSRGGGEEGNVLAGALDQLKSPLPGGIKPSVTNLAPAAGGRAAEPLAHALQRGPRELHSLRRAVTASDFELLAIRSGLVARARAYTLADLWAHAAPGTVGVSLVPAIPAQHRGEADERVTAASLAQLSTESARAKVVAILDERRPLGTKISVEWTQYKPVGVAACLIVRRGDDASAVKQRALRRISQLLSPLPSDTSGTGWPFQRSLRASQIYDVLLADPAVSYATSVRLLLPDGLAEVGQLTADPFQPATFYACSGDRLYRSMNDGRGWEPIRTFPGESVEKVICHPDQPGLLAVLTQQPGNSRPAIIRRSWTCGQSWDPDEARLDGVEDIAWTLRGGPPGLLLAGAQGLHEWTVGKAPLEVGMGQVPTPLFAVAVARHARGEVTVAVAAQDKAGVAISRQGGQGGTFERVGLVGEEIRILVTQQRDDGRVFLWAGSWSIGSQIGKGFYRCELLGPERRPEPWQPIKSWEGASALCLAFQDNIALAGSYEGGVLWTDTKGDELAWTRPDLKCGLPLRDKPRLFAQVRGLAVSPGKPLILAGGPGGLVAGQTPEAYAPRAGRETIDEVTLPPNWLFCAAPHALEVRTEDEG
ncbi:MAG TPA: baseplate J/gp47 family protein [Kofleriaceae bacterium]|nr:baseplate J/gp47 family protein [Kofleriaceae bacterium]